MSSSTLYIALLTIETNFIWRADQAGEEATCKYKCLKYNLTYGIKSTLNKISLSYDKPTTILINVTRTGHTANLAS